MCNRQPIRFQASSIDYFICILHTHHFPGAAFPCRTHEVHQYVDAVSFPYFSQSGWCLQLLSLKLVPSCRLTVTLSLNRAPLPLSSSSQRSVVFLSPFVLKKGAFPIQASPRAQRCCRAACESGRGAARRSQEEIKQWSDETAAEKSRIKRTIIFSKNFKWGPILSIIIIYYFNNYSLQNGHWLHCVGSKKGSPNPPEFPPHA